MSRALVTSKITGHHFVPDHPTLFKIHRRAQMVTELEMDPALHDDLLIYKKRVNRQRWNGMAGVFYVKAILSHRWVHGDLYYWVQWSGKWDHPIGNSEVAREDMVNGAWLDDYNNAHGIQV